MYRELNVDLYKGICEESQKKETGWKLTLNPKTSVEVLDIDNEALNTRIEEENAYEVSW